MFLAEFFFLQSLPGNRGSYLFIDYFVILGGSPRIPWFCQLSPQGMMNEKLKPSKSVGIPLPLGVPTCCLDKFFPSPIFVAVSILLPQKKQWSFQDLDVFSFVFERKIPGTAVSKIKMVEQHVTEKEKRTTACASKVPFSGFVHLRFSIGWFWFTYV